MAANIMSLTNRLTGMASGMDTDSLVRSMMQIEQMKYNNQLRSITKIQWKQETMKDIGSDLKTFMNDFTSVIGANTMMKSSNYITFNVAVTGDKASAVTAVGTSDAYAGTTVINSITQLAVASRVESGAKVSKGEMLSESNSTALSELDFANSLDFVGGKISFAINDVEFTFKSTDSLQSVINTVNSSNAGVNMVYSRLTDKISFESKEQGEKSSVKIRNILGNAVGSNSAFGVDEGAYENGKYALLSINGINVKRSSNTFTLDGIAYTLNSTFEASEGSATIKLTQNIETAVDAVKKFVDGYNTIIKKLTDLTSTRKTREQGKYVALTDEEKDSMSEKQIEQWEEIAKIGLFYNDNGITSLISGLRSALYESIEGLGIPPSEIGLRTAAFAKNGEISLDENILRSALTKNPHQVMNVFMQRSSSTDSATAKKENGLLVRINNLMNTYIKGPGDISADSPIVSSLRKESRKIEEMEKKMNAMQEKLYLKYAAMEEAMSKIQSQSNWLASMLPTMSK